MFGAPQDRPRLPLGGGGFGPPTAGTGLGGAPRPPMVGPNSPAAINARARAAGRLAPPTAGTGTGGFAPPRAGTGMGGFAPPRAGTGTGGFAPPRAGTGMGGKMPGANNIPGPKNARFSRKTLLGMGLGLGVAAGVAMNRRGEGASSGRQSMYKY